jgi:hypothetical protein
MPMATTSTVVLAARFNGPPGSANGGYACGMAAGALTIGPAEVVLRRPPPLDVPLEVVETAEGIELRRPEVGEALLVAGWQVSAEGRKLHSGGAVWGSAGEALASTSATWVLLDEEQLRAFGATG